MILSRLANAFLRQDWFTAILEIVIVVAGIYLGLQASDWSQYREDRRAEVAYLERIAVDLQASIDATEANRDFQIRHAQYGALVLRALRNCVLDADERDRFATGIYLVAKHNIASFIQASIEELLSAGRMTIIRNAALRQELVELLRLHDDHMFYMSDVQLRVTPHVNYIDSVAPVIVDSAIGGGQDISWSMLDADFSQLCADRRFFTAMAAALNYTWDSTESLMDWIEHLSAARDAVDAELARLRATAKR